MRHESIHLLFTSSGRRVALLQKFKETYQRCFIEGKVITADHSPTAPTAFFADQHYIVPKVTDPMYVEELLRICRQESITMLIPLIDSELTLLAGHRSRFEDIGVKLFLSSSELNEISCDKNKTYRFFSEHAVPTPKVYGREELDSGEYAFPLLIKPLDGSSSKGVTKINNERELRFFMDYIPNAMVQEFVSGDEYTVDVMVDFRGRVKTVVPRLRVETRAGEVSKGITKMDRAIIEAVERVVRVLPGPAGCLTLQCFKQDNGEITFIEINPRFGGGIPLSIEAGADFPLWTLQLARGEQFADTDFSWGDEITMLRYDDAVYRRA
ncbi:ATP-grasp domain-containing protein [Paenibacillus gansuensis]|uniref:ATP-grasp domain-containing protein n=1 Tax=Paenibacillus gansuensis TaxID=306542 RepID=A0ABW5PGR2_9BACL